MVTPLVHRRQIHVIAILYPAKLLWVGGAGKDVAFKCQFSVRQQYRTGELIVECRPIGMHIPVLVSKMAGYEIKHGVDDAALYPKH